MVGSVVERGLHALDVVQVLHHYAQRLTKLGQAFGRPCGHRNTEAVIGRAGGSELRKGIIVVPGVGPVGEVSTVGYD